LRILVLGDLVAYPDPLKPVGKGYVYIVEGRVEAVGRQPVPEEHRYADIVVGGKGRIVLPARTAALIHATLYPVRDFIMGRDPYSIPAARRLLEGLDCEAAWASSLLGLYEASLSGVGHAVLEDIHAECVSRAASELGIDAVIAVPAGCLENYDWRRDLSVREAGIAVCSRDVEAPRDKPLYGHGIDVDEALAVFYSPSSRAVSIATPGYIPRAERIAVGIGAWSLYDINAASLSLTASSIPVEKIVEGAYMRSLVPGSRDAVIVLRIDRPPGWVDPGSWKPSSHLSLRQVETMIVGDNVVIDGGEHLLVGEEKLREASEILKEILDNIYG